MEQTLGLYLHIPFCKSKCAYCDFYSLPHSEEKMDAYAAALLRHLEEVAPRCTAHTVDTVYFGGGTPSYLGTKRLVKILKTILKKYKVDKQAEITLEANPDSAGDWKALRTLRKCGFNRISLGMQSADDTAAVEETTEDVVDKTSVDEDQSDDDDLDIPMDRVEAVLNATVDKDSLSPQMQRMMNRQAENTRRVEESIKGTKSNPRWFVPLFCALMIIGLVWAVVYYLTTDYPIPHIGAWNLAIAFAIIMVGFIMTMWWR